MVPGLFCFYGLRWSDLRFVCLGSIVFLVRMVCFDFILFFYYWICCTGKCRNTIPILCFSVVDGGLFRVWVCDGLFVFFNLIQLLDFVIVSFVFSFVCFYLETALVRHAQLCHTYYIF